jgi:hypothetical protein
MWLWADTLGSRRVWGECEPCPFFVLYPGIRLQLKKNHGKPAVSLAENCLADQRWARLVLSTWSPFYGQPQLACWPHWPLACASGDLGQPPVNVIICRVAELRGFSHQRNLSRNCRLGLWCGRRRMEGRKLVWTCPLHTYSYTPFPHSHPNFFFLPLQLSSQKLYY